MKRCTVLSHIAFEDLDVLEPALKKRGFAIDVVDVPSQGVPQNSDDLWVIMGGPIGVYESETYPFLTAEIAAIRQRLDRKAPTLGICLGAQLMAAALGGKVVGNPRGKEIGWASLDITASGKTGPLRHLQDLKVLHWHGDMIEIPDGAETLASTALTPCQAFAYGKTALGLQFHPEVTAKGLERWLVGNCNELNAAQIGIPALRADNVQYAPKLGPAVQALADEWLTGAGL